MYYLEITFTSENIFVILFVAVVAFLYYRYPKLRKGYKDEEADSELEVLEKMKTVIEALVRQDYFKYTDYLYYKEAMQVAAEELAEGGFNCTLHSHDEIQFTSLDYRQCMLSGDDLDSYDGYAGVIEDMKEVFVRIGLEINRKETRYQEWGEEDFEDWDSEDNSEGTEEEENTLIINGKEYLLLTTHSEENSNQKCRSVKILADIINDQLALQGKSEQMYLSKDVCGEYGGHCAFMTASQYAVIAPYMNEANGASIWSVEAWSQRQGFTTPGVNQVK